MKTTKAPASIEAKAKPAKSGKSAKKAKTDEVTKAAIAKKITEKKELMYKYPEGCDDLAKRKSHRAKIRKGLQRLEKALKVANKGKGDEKPEAIEAKIKAYKKENYQ